MQTDTPCSFSNKLEITWHMRNSIIPCTAINSTGSLFIYWLCRSLDSKYHFLFFMLHRRRNYRSPQNGPNPSLTVKLFCILAEIYLGNNKAVLNICDETYNWNTNKWLWCRRRYRELKGGSFSEVKSQELLEGINI